METKHCRKCEEDLPFSSFNKDKSKKDGLRTTCSPCDIKYRAANKKRKSEVNKEWYERNKEVEQMKRRKWREENRETCRSLCRRWYKDNKERKAKSAAAYRKEKPGMALARCRKYQAAKLQRTPPWSDMSAIAEFYVEAKRLEELTGIQFHVDHIVPLQGELVSGLHVPANLQLLPAHENLSKSNSFEVAA